jgi:hypothetical protein
MKESAYTGEKFFWLGCFFTGIAGVSVALAALARSGEGRRWSWTALFASGAVMSLGAATPFFRLALWARVRYPGQFAFWMTGAALAAVTVGARAWEKGRRPRLVMAVAAAVALELFFDGFRMAPLISPDYFRLKPAWLSAVQSAPGALFLTPRAISDQRAEGRTWEETWVRFRAKGLNLSTLPYRVRNLNPEGFSLNPGETEGILEALYGAPSYAAARPLLDRFGACWVASPAPLAGADGVLRSASPWFLYERTAVRAVPVTDGNRIVIPAGGTSTAEMAYPGWQASRGRVADGGGLLSVEGAPGGSVLLFRPFAFRAGVFVAAAAWAALAVWALRRAACL